MRNIYNHLRQDKGNTYFWIKLLISMFILEIWFVDSEWFLAESNNYIAIALMVSLLTTMIYGIIFKNQNKITTFIFSFLMIDVVNVLVLLSPIYHRHFLYDLISVMLLGSMVFLISSKQKKITITIYGTILLINVLIQSKQMTNQHSIKLFVSSFAFPVLCFIVFQIISEWLISSEKAIVSLKEDKKKLLLKQSKLDKEIKLSSQRLDYLSKDLRKKSFEIQNILNLTGQFGENTDSEKIISSFMLTLIGQLGCSHALYLGLSQPTSTFYSILDTKGVHDEKLKTFRIYKDSFIIQLLKSSREPLLVNNIPQSQLYRDEVELLSHFSKDLICPITSRNKIVGMFIIGEKLNGNNFSREDMNLVSILTNQASFILEQSKVSEEIYDFYNKTVRALLRTQEIKDAYSKGHATRTAQYVRAIGSSMGIVNDGLRNLTYGTILHDIGKIVTKDEFLTYDKKFNGNDSEIKKKILDHTLVGASILKSVGFIEPVVDMALHHHEWYNGEGYPHQLNSDQISIESRILTVCNAYDAMVNDKPYRKSMNKEMAMDQLHIMAGTQFDPDIVEIFINEVNSNPNLIKLSTRH